MVLERTHRIIREKERLHLTGVPQTTWWRLEKAGKAPKGFKLSNNSKGYLLSDIQEWIITRAQGGNNVI